MNAALGEKNTERHEHQNYVHEYIYQYRSGSSDAHDSGVLVVWFVLEFAFLPYNSEIGIVQGLIDAQDSEWPRFWFPAVSNTI